MGGNTIIGLKFDLSDGDLCNELSDDMHYGCRWQFDDEDY